MAIYIPAKRRPVRCNDRNRSTGEKMNCQAIIEDFLGPGSRHYGPQRISIPAHRGCKRAAGFLLGGFCFCGPHVRLAQEGFIDENGQVLAKGTIADCRRARDAGRPIRLNRWAEVLRAKPLEKQP
jgi:hypothetical protein